MADRKRFAGRLESGTFRCSVSAVVIGIGTVSFRFGVLRPYLASESEATEAPGRGKYLSLGSTCDPDGLSVRRRLAKRSGVSSSLEEVILYSDIDMLRPSGVAGSESSAIAFSTTVVASVAAVLADEVRNGTELDPSGARPIRPLCAGSSLAILGAGVLVVGFLHNSGCVLT